MIPAAPPTDRAEWRITAGGTLVSLALHAALFLVAGCFNRLDVAPPSQPMAVEIWSPRDRTHPLSDRPILREPVPEPRTEPTPVEPIVVEPDPAPEFAVVEDLDSPELESPEFAAVTPDEPSDIPAPAPPPVLELPPAEIETPALELDPTFDPTDALGPPPLAGEVSAPPEGPARAERRREIEAASAVREREVASRVARIRGARERTAAPLPPVTTSDVTEGPLAAAEGVEGPLGKRRLIYRESPPYPEWARRQGLETDVKFRIWVNPDGVVSRVSITKRSGNTTLDALAEHALKQWRFEPLAARVPQRDEWGEVPMTFRLVHTDP